LLVIGPSRVPPSDIFAGVGGGAFVILALTFASVGAVVARPVPANRIGWVFFVPGVVAIGPGVTLQYPPGGLHSVYRLPGAAAASVANTMVGEANAALLALALLLVPDGRLPSPRWRPALGGLLVGMALLVLAGTLRPGAYASPFGSQTNPFGVPGA